MDDTRDQGGNRREATDEATTQADQSRRPLAGAAAGSPPENRRSGARNSARASRVSPTRREGVDGDPFGRFLRAAARIPLLTAAEEVALSKRVQQGDRDAITAFVEANIRLIVTIAEPYAHAAHIPLEDLVNEGVFGVWRAAEKFDWRRGTRFSTYATWWIRMAVRRYMVEQRHTLHITGHAQERIAVIRRTEAALTAQLGRRPTAKEIAARAHLESEEVALLRDLHDAILFEDRSPRTDDPGAAEETFGDPSSVTLDERSIDGEILKTRLDRGAGRAHPDGTGSVARVRRLPGRQGDDAPRDRGAARSVGRLREDDQSRGRPQVTQGATGHDHWPRVRRNQTTEETDASDPGNGRVQRVAPHDCGWSRQPPGAGGGGS